MNDYGQLELGLLWIDPMKQIPSVTTTYPSETTQTTGDVCFICNNKNWYRDYAGIWHKCPRCENNYTITSSPISVSDGDYSEFTEHDMAKSQDVPKGGARRSL